MTAGLRHPSTTAPFATSAFTKSLPLIVRSLRVHLNVKLFVSLKANPLVLFRVLRAFRGHHQAYAIAEFHLRDLTAFRCKPCLRSVDLVTIKFVLRASASIRLQFHITMPTEVGTTSSASRSGRSPSRASPLTSVIQSCFHPKTEHRKPCSVRSSLRIQQPRHPNQSPSRMPAPWKPSSCLSQASCPRC